MLPMLTDLLVYAPSWSTLYVQYVSTEAVCCDAEALWGVSRTLEAVEVVMPSFTVGSPRGLLAWLDTADRAVSRRML